ncbi:MAG: hypothetical protein LBC68_02615 [Prevotellaceae bacterium]|nr:hypothetical protein [Prevotellaceae bacterium]
MSAFGIGSACVVLKAKLRFAQVGRLASICDVAKDATPNGVIVFLPTLRSGIGKLREMYRC